MPTHGWFSTPIYIDQLQDTEYDEVQQELFSTIKQLDFGQNPQWNRDTHELNAHAFSQDILTKFKCEKFLTVLDRHLNLYLDQIDCTYRRKYSISQSWFTKTKHGQYAHRHDHGATDISGVYYVQTNEKDGNLLMQPPSQALSSNFVYSIINKDITFPLGQGIIGLWPGNVVHETRANETQDERISLSFNIQYER